MSRFRGLHIGLGFILLIVIITFIDLPKTFYQQDEWQVLGHNLAQGIRNVINYTTPIQLFFAEQRPLNRVLNQFFFGYLRHDVFLISIYAISLHIINSFLLFYLTLKLTKNITVSFFSSLFFSVSSVAHQAVTWPAASIGTLPSAAFILISMIFYFKFLEKKNIRDLYASFIICLISLFFKETGLFLFALYPILYVFNNKKLELKKTIKIHIPFIVYGFSMITFRTFEIFKRTESAAGFVSGASYFKESLIFHVLFYPLTSFFQIFVPPKDLFPWASKVTSFQYRFLADSPVRELVAQSVTTDLISIFGSLFLFGLVLIILNINNDKLTRNAIFFAILFFFLSFMPYIVLNRDSSYLSSRYFYVGGIGAGIIFGYFTNYILKINRFIKYLFLILVSVYIINHIQIIRNDINYQVNLGNQRKAVLEGIREIYPTLNDKTVFYVTGDKEYYGPITNPFQNGLGYVLETWYYDSGKIPDAFLSENFLWDLGAEGYRESGNFGFGYYQDIDKMVIDMKNNDVPLNTIKAFYITSQDNKVNDITPEIISRVSTISGILK